MSLRDFISTGSYLTSGFIKDKYIVLKADGSPTDPEAVYFPLRLDNDPYAREAARVYADRIEKTNPKLASDLRLQIEEAEELHARRTGYGDE